MALAIRKKQSNLAESLTAALRIDGAIGAALGNWRTGQCLSTVGGGGGVSMPAMVARNVAVMRGKLAALQAQGFGDEVEYLSVVQGQERHLLRFSAQHPEHFLYLVMHQSQTDLVHANHTLQTIEARLTV